MLVFLDFEASSLSERSYPIEVGWVFEDGREEDHLIRPAPEWTDWDPSAEAIHGISRNELLERGRDHTAVAQRMVEVLAGHDICASAPSWDGKWLSALLRASGIPRRTLRLRGSDEVLEEATRSILAEVLPDDELDRAATDLLTRNEIAQPHPAHRALADAQQERQRWIALRKAAEELARPLRRANTSAAPG